MRFNKYILILLLLFSNVAYGAVANDTADSIFGQNVNDITISNFTVTGANTLALCSTTSFQSTPAEMSVTFNSVAMDQETTQLIYDAAYQMVFKKSGVSGTHDFVLTSTHVDPEYLALECSTHTGVHQTTPLGTVATATTPDRVNMTVPTNGLSIDFAVDIWKADCSNPFTEGTGQTSIIEVCSNFGEPGLEIQLMSSTRSTSGVHDWSALWKQIGYPINPVATAPSRRKVIQ